MHSIHRRTRISNEGRVRPREALLEALRRALPACVAAALLVLSWPADARTPRVVASIAPLHALVAGVMQGVDEPILLLPPGASPHAYSLKPSDARALQRADVIVWVGDALESFLQKPVANLSSPSKLLTASDMDGLTLLHAREGEAWGEHDHADAGAHGSIDPHLWLDPANARLLVAAVAKRLSALDPANGPRYRANADALGAEIDSLDRRIRTRLAPVRDRPYVVFHDAYHYFEDRYGLNPVGAITLSPERAVGARQLATIRARIAESGAKCVFREPQFEPKIAQAAIRGSDARLAVLDPIGTELEPGPRAYFELMERMTESLVGCLGGR